MSINGKVICRGYKTCEDRITCKHSKPHKQHCYVGDECFLPRVNIDDECDCIKFNLIRKQKLEKLNEYRG